MNESPILRRYVFTHGLVSVVVYATTLASAQQYAWIYCEETTRKLYDVIGREDSDLLVEVTDVPTETP